MISGKVLVFLLVFAGPAWGQTVGSGITQGSGSSRWSALIDPVGNLSLTMSAFTSLWTFNSATGANDLFKLTDGAANTGTGALFRTSTANGSTALPWQADANGVGWQVDATGALASVGTGTSGTVTLKGSGSGQASISVAAAAGTPADILLPAATASAGDCLSSDGASPQQLSWIACGGASVWQESGGAITPVTATDTVAPGTTTFGSLPASSNGAQVYCSDCTVTSSIDNTCAGTGSGAMATRVNGAWKCAI